ncbi:MAG: undecaprenyl-diphosphate phosphatase, partial [Peptococcaceae bacterium]|nr:undecaprenyl-diphosphate phosphatase [Peptococcaceae bacterium]
KTIATSRRKRNRSLDVKSLYDLRLIKTATFPLLICLLLCVVVGKWKDNLLTVMCFLIVNGLILLFAEHIQHGNRDSRTMTGLDGIIMGILGALSSFPGISRTGIVSAYATARGADNQNAANWAFLLGIPAIVFAACYDIILIFSSGVGTLSLLLIVGCILIGIGAFVGGYIAISILVSILNHAGYSPFAYYSLGAALFSFVLYLIT